MEYGVLNGVLLPRVTNADTLYAVAGGGLANDGGVIPAVVFVHIARWLRAGVVRRRRATKLIVKREDHKRGKPFCFDKLQTAACTGHC